MSFLPDGSILKINNTLLKWLGYQREEIIPQKKITDLISNGNNIHYQMFFWPMINMSGKVKEVNYDLIKCTGELLPTLFTATAVKDAAGKLIAINTAISDITDRKKYEKELLNAKEHAVSEKKRFEILTNLIPEIIFTADSAGTIDYLNHRFFQYFRQTKTTFTIRSLIAKIYKDDRKKAIHAWTECINNKNNCEFEIRLMSATNEYEWHLIRLNPFYDTEGAVSKWFGSCYNIHKQVEALQRKDEFINVASHELKTPMTSLKAYLQILEQSEVPENFKVLVEKAISSFNNLQFLTTSLLDVSTINSGDLNLNFSRFSLSALIEECIEQVRFNYQSHQMIFEKQPMMPAFVLADKERMSEVIINLLNNAIKYSPDANKVIIRLIETPADFVTLEIEDFGIGISPDKSSIIFNRYYRVNNEASNKIKGLGLGLYIIQNIMLKHKSKIFLRSVPGKGSVFYFCLPLTGK